MVPWTHFGFWDIIFWVKIKRRLTFGFCYFPIVMKNRILAFHNKPHFDAFLAENCEDQTGFLWGVHVYVGGGVWIQAFFPTTSYIIFWDWMSQWTSVLPNWLNLLAGKPQRPSSFCLSSAGIQVWSTMLVFPVDAGNLSLGSHT